MVTTEDISQLSLSDEDTENLSPHKLGSRMRIQQISVIA